MPKRHEIHVEVTKQVTAKEGKITGIDLRRVFNIPTNATLTVEGRDMDESIDIDDYPIMVRWEETK